MIMTCGDQGSGSLSDTDLRAASASDDLLKFFDRVRLALTYNLALQAAPNLEAPVHLCQIGKEILSDAQGVADIRGLVERSPALKQKVGLILSHEPLKYAALRLPVLIKSLQHAGFLVGMTLDRDLIAAPSDIVRLNPNFVMIPGAVMVDALRKPSQLAIHPADLIALFERGGIDMIAGILKQKSTLKRLKVWVFISHQAPASDRFKSPSCRHAPKRIDPCPTSNRFSKTTIPMTSCRRLSCAPQACASACSAAPLDSRILSADSPLLKDFVEHRVSCRRQPPPQSPSLPVFRP